MFKTDSRKGIAVLASAVLAFAGLASVPAQAAVAGLNVAPEKGTSYVVPVTDRIDIKVFAEAPLASLTNLKFIIANDGGHKVNFQTATGSGAVTATEVLGTASTSAVVSATTSAGAITVLSLDLNTAALDLSSASETVTVTAFIDSNGNGLADDLNVAAPITVTFLDGDLITWTNEFASPVIGATSLVASLSTTDVNMLEMNDGLNAFFTEGATSSAAVSMVYNTTLGKFRATAISTSWAVGLTHSGTLAQGNVAIGGPLSTSGQVSALTYQANMTLLTPNHTPTSKDLGVTISRAVSALGIGAINGVSTSATATNTKLIDARVTVSPSATSVKVTAAAVTASTAVANSTITFTIAETSAASMDAGAVLTVGTSTVRFTNTGVQTLDGEFTAVTDAKGIATLDIGIAGAKDGNSFTIVASLGGVALNTSPVTYTFLTNTAGSAAVLDMVNVSGLDPVLAGVAKDASFALNFAVLDTYGSLLTTGNHSVRLSSGAQTVSSAVNSDGRALVTWPGFATVGSKVITAQVLKNGAAVAGASSTINVNVGTAGVPAAVSQTSVNLGTALTPTLSLTTKVWTNADTRLGQAATAELDGEKELTGVVTNAAGIAVAGADVTLTGTGLYFNVGDTLYTTGTVTVKTNANGVYKVEVHSLSSGKKTVAITSGAATRSVDLFYVGAVSTAATNIAITTNAVAGNVVPGSTLRVVVKLTDAAGNAVSVASTDAAKFSISVAGPGFVSSPPSITDVNGEAMFSILLGSQDAGNIVVTATYDRDGTATVHAAITATNTVTVSSAVAPVVPVADQKVNVGSFKGFVALYAKGYAGQRMSAIVAGRWIVVPALGSGFERVVRFTGAGFNIDVKIYIDRVLTGTFSVLTK